GASIPEADVRSLAAAPPALAAVAERAGATALLALPLESDGAAGTLELLRAGDDFGPSEHAHAAVAAAQAALVLRSFGEADGAAGRDALGLAGDALALSGDERAADRLVRLATEA